jgi:glucose-6-phosphate dehydrogenase assembly protein OpcA
MEYPMIEVTPVDPGDIEGSLDNLWEQNKGENRFRACLFNLIIYSSSSTRLPYLSLLAEHIIEKFPSRVLMIKEGDSPSDQIKSSVANLKEKVETSSIFCDYIEFEVGKGAHKSIPFMVLPHLVADHPIYLLWDDDPLLKDPVSFALENTADRTIFDSNVTTDLKNFAETLIDLQGQVECSIADLNWARITPFKDLLTTIFTDQVHFRVIDALKDLHIYYNKDQGNQGGYYRALYLQAYLASMMNFKYVSTLKSNSETHIHYRHKSKEVTICLLETNQKDLYPGFIQQLEFTSYDGTHLKLERMQKNKQVVEVQTTFCTHCQIPSHHIFDPDLNNRTLTREIYSKGTDPHFEKVLKLLSQCEGI